MFDVVCSFYKPATPPGFSLYHGCYFLTNQKQETPALITGSGARTRMNKEQRRQ